LHVDLSMLDGLISLLGYLAEMHFFTGENPGRVGSSHHTIVPYGRFEVKDGHIVIALHVGSFWRKFCLAIGREDLVQDPRFRTTADRSANRAALEEIVTAVLKTRTAAEWTQILGDADVPHGPVNNVGEALAQPVVAARGLLKTIQHPQAGEVKVVGSPLNFGNQFPDQAYAAAPLLGGDTVAVLEEFGYSQQDIERLLAEGAIATPQQASKPDHD
jgi:crotonobetainyl-CoA:carnitine CoA-transferase CaiB-like acyl-CoA transferase